ncbi:50S ribosomal protein L25 [Thalassoglobus neptunius]|uniref:Large ribosomal subunit protein bL25 n=1 Tax=Thalassoglobus neptunius TaxID=1938619 RepID=A0A5C5X0G7_9PLAN|nr:50S ribosomal protein L25 [Thalassoglobus neptunius]TWT55781.1 50S ribosomal protein L25 [Thalassoglobus neptunius]
MSTIEKLTAAVRSSIGSTASRRLRSEGIVPANIYGHKQTPQAVQMQADIVHAMIHSGSKVFDLEIDNSLEKVLIKDIQWDTFSKHVMHIDFLRVDPTERVKVEVPVTLRGTAPGALQGGILEQPMHTIEVECLAVEIPESITVRIGSLQLGESLHVNELTELPAGLTVLSPEDSVIVHIAHEAPAVEPVEEDAPEDPADVPATAEG